MASARLAPGRWMMKRTLIGRLTAAIEKTTPTQNFVGVARAAQAMPSQTIARSSVPRRNWKRRGGGLLVEAEDMSHTEARRHREDAAATPQLSYRARGYAPHS